MKRTITLLLMAFMICLAANAQITNKIWGLTLGVSTKQQVLNVISQKKLKITDRTKDWISCESSSSFKFGGENWETAFFVFYKGKLCYLSFKYYGPYSEAQFDQLKISLDNKYSEYLHTTSNPNYKKYMWYGDDKTSVEIFYEENYSGDYVSISYGDNKLILRSAEEEQSEL